MRYEYTSRIDGFVRVFIGIPLLFATMFAVGAIIHYVIPLRPLGVSNSTAEWVEGLGGLALGIIVYQRVFAIQVHTLSSFLYLRFALWTPVSWAEARALAPLFVLTEHATWIPFQKFRNFRGKNGSPISIVPRSCPVGCLIGRRFAHSNFVLSNSASVEVI